MLTQGFPSAWKYLKDFFEVVYDKENPFLNPALVLQMIISI